MLIYLLELSGETPAIAECIPDVKGHRFLSQKVANNFPKVTIDHMGLLKHKMVTISAFLNHKVVRGLRIDEKTFLSSVLKPVKNYPVSETSSVF